MHLYAAGFEPQLRKIVDGSDLPKRNVRQTLLFSATFPPELQAVAKKSYLRPKYASVAVGRVGASNAKVEQRVVECIGDGTKHDKLKTMIPLLLGEGNAEEERDVCTGDGEADSSMSTASMEKTIIFCNKKFVAAWVAKELEKHHGVRCAQIHGNRSQPQREAALLQFRNDEVRVLVATDAVARGIDVADVTHVIQFDLPISPKAGGEGGTQVEISLIPLFESAA